MKRFLLFTTIIFTLLSACQTPSDKSENEGKTVFRYNEPAGITSLDPAFARNMENIWAVNQIYNGLVQMNDQLEVRPCIAKRWEISEDGLVYTFHLRDDVYFHDHELFEHGKGRKVTATDFVHSFFRISDRETASPGAYIFNYVDRSKKSNYLGFVAENDTTLKIYLDRSFPPFLGILTMQYCSVVPHEIVEYYENDFRRNPVGTGPFKFKTWKEGVKLVLVKNHNYFEKDEDGSPLPYLDAVSISFVKDRQLNFLDFLRGNYDFVSNISGLDATYRDEILTQEGELQTKYVDQFRMEKHPYLKTDYLGILIDPEREIVANSPLKEKYVRQALNYAIDREKMVKYLRNNVGVPAHSGFLPKGIPAFDAQKVKGYSYDPEKAKELLFLAGYPGGKDLPKIVLTTTSIGMYQDICEFIQHELSDVGIKSSVEVIDAATFREMVARSNVNIFRKSWIADYPDAENFLALFYSKNFSPQGPNYTHFENPRFDRLYEQAAAQVNDSIRYEYYREMDQMIIEEAPVIPLYYDELIRFIQNDIQGLESNPMNLLTLKKVRKIDPKRQIKLNEQKL